MNKTPSSVAEALAPIPDGVVIMLGGFGGSGAPNNLVAGLVEQGATNLTIIVNGAFPAMPLIERKRVSKIICSYPLPIGQASSSPLAHQLYSGEIQLEVVPQGTLAERIRAGGAGIAGFYTPTGVDTEIEQGKEKRVFEGKEYLLERGLTADFALIKAHLGDPLGNLVYRLGARNFNPIMAMAGRFTIAEVDEIVEVGQLDPQSIVTPSIFVQKVVKVPKKVLWIPSAKV